MNSNFISRKSNKHTNMYVKGFALQCYKYIENSPNNKCSLIHNGIDIHVHVMKYCVVI